MALPKKRNAPYGKQGIIVRITPSGEVRSAENWDGSEIEYENDAKKISRSILAFFEVPSKKRKAKGFLRRDKSTWKIRELYGGLDENKRAAKELLTEQVIMAHISPDGRILKLANLDGSKIKQSKSVNYSNARLYVHNGCCWKKVYGVWKCRSSYCPR